MIDEKKVRLMTRLAIYEKHENKRSIAYSKYYQSDYVRYNVLKTWVSSTVVFWAVVAFYVTMNFEEILLKVSEVDYFDLMYKLLGAYVVFCLIYFVIATVLYNYRYISVKDGLTQYNSDLKDLIELEGGPMHHIKVIDDGEKTVTDTRSKTNRPEDRNPERRKPTVNRTAVIQQQQKQQDDAYKQQIIDNQKSMEERRQRAKEMRERQAALDRQKIQERRKQLEQEQLERIRQEQKQMMARENHTYVSTNDAPAHSKNLNKTNKQ